MKELTIEEKAKRYNQAIKVAKSKIKNDKDHVLYEDDVIDIFPELKESEDERIRKALISFLKSPFVNESITDEKVIPWIAWLEKQGQKPAAWSEEDEMMLEGTIDKISDLGTGEMCKEWLKSIKDRVQPKQEWSDVDKDILFRIINDLKFLRDTISTDPKYAVNIINTEREITWLKSLRPQINVTDEELAQAKKDAYNNVLNKLEYDSENPTFDDGWSAAIWYLKKRNIIPQLQWKPSDAQMNAIKDAIDYLGGDTKIVRKHLMSLYQDLKKLREE